MKSAHATRAKTPTTRTRSQGSFAFQRDRLPLPATYYAQEGLALSGRGLWCSVLCPFHHDSRPSLRVNQATGAFRCMACGAHGGDVLAFYMLRHEVRFVEAAKALGAWGEQS